MLVEILSIYPIFCQVLDFIIDIDVTKVEFNATSEREAVFIGKVQLIYHVTGKVEAESIFPVFRRILRKPGSTESQQGNQAKEKYTFLRH